MRKKTFTLISLPFFLFGTSTIVAQENVSMDLQAVFEYLTEDRVAPVVVKNENLKIEELYRAIEDGCYFGIGDEKNTYNSLGIDCEECIEQGGKPKINGSYLWGLTQMNGKIYYGTIENLLCSAFNSIAGEGMETYETGCWVCEGPLGPYGSILSSFGDWQPPHMFVYDPKEGITTEITPDYDPYEFCVGIRSAGAHEGVVFLAGPDFAHGLTVYAYNAEDDSYLGSSHLRGISDDPSFLITNVRKWQVIEGVLYFGVQYSKGGGSGGAIIRWNGSAEDPFNFEIVGYTEGEAAELEYHDGRIYVGGWPGTGLGSTESKAAGVYRSPIIPEGGFTAADATEWETVWRVDEYDTDPVVSKLVGLGGFKTYKGQLYWGLLYVSWATIFADHGGETEDEKLANAFATFRSSALFRATDFSSPDDVELLYGEDQIPMYNAETESFYLANNASNYKAKWGRSGIGNLFTNYIWSIEKYNDRLYVGTMDMGILVYEFLKSMSPELLPLMEMFLKVEPEKFGFECLVIEDPEKTPTLLTDNGLGNTSAYGLRNFIVHDDVLYVGTANPLSLDENGGWRLLSIYDTSITGTAPVLPKEVAIMIAQHGTNLNVSLLNGDSIDRIVLNDVSGRTLKTQAGTGSRELTVSTEGLSAGVYVLSVVTGDKQETAKIRIR